MRKKTGNKLHTWEAALLLAVAAALLWGACTLQRQDALEQKVIRLHVIANSDSEADQALKLRVRDRVLVLAEDILRQSRDMEEARQRLAGGAAPRRRRPSCSRRRRRRSPLRAADTPSAPGWRRRSFLHGSMTALHYPPESIWLCGWSSGREPGKTGGAWCSHPCVPLPPATFRRRPSPAAWGRRICPSSPRRTAATSCGSGRWSFGRACASGWESTERRGRPVGGVGEKIPYGMLNLYSSEIYDT